MRKLAREAVIFMLLTPLLFVVGAFVYLYHDAHKIVVFDLNKAQPIPCMVEDKYIDGGRTVWQCENGVRTPAPQPKPAFDPNQPYIDLSAGIVPKPTSELLGMALMWGLYGFPAGFGLWIFYRIIRFAING